MPSSAEVRTTPPQAASGAPELVKGLGLTSATTLVMGSMIGSGIFIVSAEIAREVNSPALLIGAWLVTGFMTIAFFMDGLCFWSSRPGRSPPWVSRSANSWDIFFRRLPPTTGFCTLLTFRRSS